MQATIDSNLALLPSPISSKGCICIMMLVYFSLDDEFLEKRLKKKKQRATCTCPSPWPWVSEE
jgi:hypothetical protein